MPSRYVGSRQAETRLSQCRRFKRRWGRKMINAWWADEPGQRFWMETLRRPDYGDAIRAPHTKQNGTAWPYYELVKYVRDGDIILHWDTNRRNKPSAFVGWSVVDGAPYETDNIAYNDGTSAHGTEALVRDYTSFDEPLGLDSLNRKRRLARIKSVRDRLEERIDGLYYFPFDIRKDNTIRARQGAYLTRFPVELFEALPELASARTGVVKRRSSTSRTERSPETRIDRRQAREAGYISDAQVRRAVEMQAVAQATAHYKSRGYRVKDVGASRPYDLHLTRFGDEERHVEVKGSTGAANEVELTIGEVEHAHDFQPTDLFVVGGIEWERTEEGVSTRAGDARLIENWTPSSDSLRAVRFRHTVPAATKLEAIRIDA